MNAKELIAELSRYDEESEVSICAAEYSLVGQKTGFKIEFLGRVESVLLDARVDQHILIVMEQDDSQPAKKVETKTILSCEEFDNLKKRIRKEIAEECRRDVDKELSALIGETSISWRNEFEEFHKDSTERILKIIRGD